MCINCNVPEVIYIHKKSIGSIINPCGTPCLSIPQLEQVLLFENLCSKIVKNIAFFSIVMIYFIIIKDVSNFLSSDHNRYLLNNSELTLHILILSPSLHSKKISSLLTFFCFRFYNVLRCFYLVVRIHNLFIIIGSFHLFHHIS